MLEHFILKKKKNTSVYTCLSAYTPFTLINSSLHLCPSTILRIIVNTNIYLSHGVHTEKDNRQFESIQYLLGYREYAYQVPISTYYSNYNRGFIVFLSYIAQLYRYRKYYLYCYTTNLLVVIPREPFKKNIQMFYPYNFMSAVTRWRVLKVMSYRSLACRLQMQLSEPKPQTSHILYCTVSERGGGKGQWRFTTTRGSQMHPLSQSHTYTRTAWQKPSVFLGMKISKFAWQQVMSAAPLVPTVTGGFFCCGNRFLIGPRVTQ